MALTPRRPPSVDVVEREPSIDLDAGSILFEDAHLVAVDKAAGWLSDATRDPRRDHLGAALSRWAEDQAGDGTFLPVHRLDRATSGVVLFARSAEAATGVMQQFQERSVSKRYCAIVTPPVGEWPAGSTFERRSHLRHRKGRTEEVRTGGKVAESRFEVVDRGGRLALITARPRTGRTHQLRVHLAALGAPIVGDDLYGDGGAPVGRMWLHAERLDLRHPGTAGPLAIRSRRTFALTGGRPEEAPAT